MKTFKNLWGILAGIAGILLFATSCEKSPDITEDPEMQIQEQEMDFGSNEFEGPLPAATVPLKTYFSSGLNNKSSHEETSSSTLTPSIEATLRPGESHTETVTGTIDGAPSLGDVMFIMDLTGSMGGELNNAKANSINIMNAIRNLIPNTNFGLSSHMDYPAYYSGCGYGTTYGNSGVDYPYMLDASLSDDLSAVETGLNSLSLGAGVDGPENYTRPLWELSNDPATGWRAGSKKIAIAWLDNIPHDCNVFGLIDINTVTTGPDPGRNAIANDDDDLVFVETLEQMRDNEIALITLYSGTSSTSFNLWAAASELTGGRAYQINTNGTIPGGGDLAESLAGLIAEDLNTINRLRIAVCDEAYSSWLTGVGPEAYFNIELDSPVSRDYDVSIIVPEGTEPGTYEFDLCLIGDGAEYARTSVTITVPDEQLTVALDIHPTSCPNPLPLRRNGVIPVSISGSADFDVQDIDISSVTLEGVSALRYAFEDVSTPYFISSEEPLDQNDCHTLGADGIMDLSLKFDSRQLVSALGTLESGQVLILTIIGKLKNGNEFSGQDIVFIP